MKTFLKLVAGATLVAIVGMAAVAVVAVAQAPDDTDGSPFADWRQEMHQAIARALGIDVAQYEAAVEQARDEVLAQAVQEGDLTQAQADQMRERMAAGRGPGMMGGRGPLHGGGMLGGRESSLIAVAAEQLDMTVEELWAEIQDGKSIADVAQEKGVSTQAIADTFLAQREEWLGEAVAAGRLTQAQADAMLAHMAEQVEAHIAGELPAGGYGPGGCGGGRGPMGGGGLMRGWHPGRDL